MMTRFAIAAALIACASPALAFSKIDSKADFLAAVQGKSLTLPVFGVSLKVDPSGTISGRGFGRDVTGTWSWKSGYFCREMNAEGRVIPYTCQLIELQGNKMRITSDKGAGQTATFRLR